MCPTHAEVKTIEEQLAGAKKPDPAKKKTKQTLLPFGGWCM